MRYGIGDKIVIRDDLVASEPYGGIGFNDTMRKFENKAIVIEDISNNEPISYVVKGWHLTDGMIDHEATSKVNVADDVSEEGNIFNYNNNEKEMTYLSWEVVKELTECNSKRFKNLKTKLIVGGSNKISDIMFFDDEWVEVDLKPAEFIDAFALFRTYSTDMVCFYNGEYIYFIGDEDTEYSFLESWIDLGEWFVVK